MLRTSVGGARVSPRPSHLVVGPRFPRGPRLQASPPGPTPPGLLCCVLYIGTVWRPVLMGQHHPLPATRACRSRALAHVQGEGPRLCGPHRAVSCRPWPSRRQSWCLSPLDFARGTRGPGRRRASVQGPTHGVPRMGSVCTGSHKPGPMSGVHTHGTWRATESHPSGQGMMSSQW